MLYLLHLFFYDNHYKWEHPIRSLGIRAVDLVLDDIPVQLELFGNQEKQKKLEKMDCTVDEIRRRFGYFSIQRAVMYGESVMTAEYRPVEYGKDYDVVDNPDKFQLYIDGNEIK